MSDVMTCKWDDIDDLASAKAALRGTISILSFELTDKELDLNRIDALAESISDGTKRIDELTRSDDD